MEKWYDAVDTKNRNFPKDMCSGDWAYLFNDLKNAYAEYMGWDEDYYENDDLLYKSECAAYEVIAEIREQLGY